LAPTLLALWSGIDPMQGKAEAERLLVDVVQALLRGGLNGTVDTVNARLLSKPADALFETRAGAAGWECHFKPMVELLLREILFIASRAGRPAELRHAQIAHAITLAGF
jgi:hypothetical protein